MTTSIHDPATAGRSTELHWGSIIAGAIAAAAVAFVLHSFAIAIGLSVSSTAPTWRDTSFALVLLSGLYLLLAALAAYGFGAYVTGRMRSVVVSASADDTAFVDGMHGLLAWALATLLAGLLALATLQALPRLTPSSALLTGSSVIGETIIADDLDRLFRAERRVPGVDMSYVRAEAARILLTASSHRGLQSDDRAYLVRLVAANTGLATPDADRRVNDVIARAHEDVARARRSGVILGFMIGVAALAGAAVAWSAAGAAGRYRDGRIAIPSLLDWNKSFEWRKPFRGT
jgi:hypothetical protein